MAKKYKYYLVRMTNEFYLARGEAIYQEEIEGLALVRIDEYRGTLAFKGQWTIIDVASGLNVGIASFSKKKVVDNLVSRWSDEFKERILHARKGETYLQKRIPEMDIEKKNWRASGYEVE